MFKPIGGHLLTGCCAVLLLAALSAAQPNADEIDEFSRNQALPFWLSVQSQRDVSVWPKLANLINRVGPNMRASADYHDFDDVHLNESLIAWHLLHDQTKQFAQNQVQVYRPKLVKLLADSNVSANCRQAVETTLNSMEDLDDWPVQMWSSTGSFPPSGLLDGQFTDVGSYRGCVDLKLPQNSTRSIGHTSYCIMAFRPIVPSRPRFHMIFRQEPDELLNLFNKSDAFNTIAHWAQYFHYVYLKTSVCVPYQCSAEDMQRVSVTLAKRLILMAGPVKCFTRAPYRNLKPPEVTAYEIETRPIEVEIDRPMNLAQVVSLSLVASFYALVLLATVWHAIELALMSSGGSQSDTNDKLEEINQIVEPIEYVGIKHIAIDYLSIITNAKEFLDTSMRRNEIKCLHGLRVITMAWIICVHTLQYNEWAGFTRIFENVSSLQNAAFHPIYNANYVVDNFFFMSGVLASYTAWYANKGTASNFSLIISLIGRYLRLTPQVLLVSLLYILLPLVSHGPFWFDMTHHAAKYCEKNWWVNLLHLQAFYREGEMCNLVGWWISVDMLYYAVALPLLWLVLSGRKGLALASTALWLGFCLSMTVYRHFLGGYTPNNLGVVPQIGEVWTEYIVYFFWSPYPHAFPFFLGFWVGYIIANNKFSESARRWSKVCWTLTIVSLATVSMSSRIWMTDSARLDNQYISTSYNSICTIVWALAFAWIVIACHYGRALRLTRILSSKLFVLVSKASFIIYLSHMLVVRLYYGVQNSLLEVSMVTLAFITIGNTFLSTLFGIFLCITFEGPLMKFQKFVISSIKQSRQLPQAGASYTDRLEVDRSEFSVTLHKVGSPGSVLLK